MNKSIENMDIESLIILQQILGRQQNKFADLLKFANVTSSLSDIEVLKLKHMTHEKLLSLEDLRGIDTDSIFMKKFSTDLNDYIANFGCIKFGDIFEFEINLDTLNCYFYRREVKIGYEATIRIDEFEFIVFNGNRDFSIPKAMNVAKVYDTLFKHTLSCMVHTDQVQTILQNLLSFNNINKVLETLGKFTSSLTPSDRKTFNNAILEYAWVDFQDIPKGTLIQDNLVENLLYLQPFIEDWMYVEDGGIVINRSGFLLVLEKSGDNYFKKDKNTDIFQRYWLLQKMKNNH